MPGFLKKMRKVAFARIFSADKNVSIFLGRPPRMSRHHLRLTKVRRKDSERDPAASLVWPADFQWPPPGQFNYATESRWSAICAVFKERALELYQLDGLEDRAHQAM